MTLALCPAARAQSGSAETVRPSDLLMKMCEGNEYHLCPEDAQATWVAGRVSVKF